MAPQSVTEREIALEQGFVDRAYRELDRARAYYRHEQRRIESSGAWGSPQARTERDAFAAHFGDEAARLEAVEDRLVFGRLDYLEGPERYIGRVGLREGADQILTDWRAPAALPFYQATALNPQSVVRRRHVGTKMRKVTSIEDELLDADGAAQAGTILQGEGALMAAMGSGREGHMSDIVATIQAEQDAIVRAPSDGLLVVQGGPGTGKTAVALHRAAYLLYHEHKRLQRSGVLIVGPSRTFLRYIEEVLPSLGETGVVNTTVGELFPGVRATISDPVEIGHIKGLEAWINICQRLVRSLQRLPHQDQTLKIGNDQVVMTVGDVKRAMSKARRVGGTHNAMREIFALQMVENLLDCLIERDADPADRAFFREEIRSSIDARRAINLCWMPTSPQTLLRRLYARPALLAANAPELNTKQRQLLYRDPESDWSIDDVPILDELAELLGPHQQVDQKEARAAARRRLEIDLAQQAIDSQGLGSGIVTAQMLAQRAGFQENTSTLAERASNDRTWTYGHIVVDEAQELSPLAWHCLLRRCPARSFTIVGDLDQRSGKRVGSWAQLLGPAKRALRTQTVLSVAYRTPAAIMTKAEDVFTALEVPPVYPVTAARDLPDAFISLQVPQIFEAAAKQLNAATTYLDQTLGKDLGRVALIVADTQAQDFYEHCAQNIDLGTALNGRCAVLGATAAKGLEFDIVIIADPGAIAAQGAGDLYVAMTRPTRRLVVIYQQKLPDTLIALEAN